MTDKAKTDQDQAAIDRLLDGSLSTDEARRLRDQADQDAQLAKSIINAYQIQNSLEQLGIQRAPAQLKRRLRAIPASQRQTTGLAWPIAATAALSLVIAIGVIRTPAPPSVEQINQARHELALAMSYLRQYGVQTQHELQQEIGGTLTHALIEGIREGVSEDSNST